MINLPKLVMVLFSLSAFHYIAEAYTATIFSSFTYNTANVITPEAGEINLRFQLSFLTTVF